MAGLVIRGLTKVYPGGIHAVRGLDLEVGEGQLVVLVGPSGCGKTSVLRMIAGLERPTAGRISIGGRPADRLRPDERDVAMVFQSHALYPHLNVFDNLAFAWQLRHGGSWLNRLWQRGGWRAGRGSVVGQRVEQAAGRLGLLELLGRRPAQLSGGERQRVALGRALVREPAVYLLDEPLAHLDARMRVDVRRQLKRLHGELGATMVYVTHDQAEAMTLADRLVVLDRGRVQQVGRPHEVYEAPRNRFVAGFVGSVPMNFLDGTAWRAGAGWHFSAGGWELELPAGVLSPEALGAARAADGGVPLVVGVRAEHLEVVPAGGPSGAGLSAVSAGLSAVSVGLSAASVGLSAAARAVVRMVEPLGEADLVHLELAGPRPDRNNRADGEPISLVAKVTSRTAFQPGAAVGVAVRVACAHVFDPTTGRRLPEAGE